MVSAQVDFAAACKLQFWCFQFYGTQNVLHLNAGGFGQLGAESLNLQVCYDGLAIGWLWFGTYDNVVETIHW